MDKQILEILQRIESGQLNLHHTIAALSNRLNKTNHRQRRQQNQINNLQDIIAELQAAPKLRENPVCLDRKNTYKTIDKFGDRDDILRALLDGGYIQGGENGRKTKNERINGEVRRVIVINM